MSTIVLIADALLLGIPIAVFIIFYIKGTNIEESAKQAYIVLIVLILLAVMFLFISNPNIDEDTKNRYLYVGLILAFIGLILAMQGDIKGIQRHTDLNLKITNIQDKIDQGIERFDRIERFLEGSTDQRVNNIPEIVKEIQKDPENSTSIIEVEHLPAAESSKESHEKNKTTPVTFGSELTDEDKIIFEHLSKRHEDLLSFADALDSKLAQIIALNGLILSFVFYRGTEAAIPSIFISGLFVIVISIIFGVFGYCCQEFSAGLSGNFFRDYKGFDSGKGLSIEDFD